MKNKYAVFVAGSLALISFATTSLWALQHTTVEKTLIQRMDSTWNWDMAVLSPDSRRLVYVKESKHGFIVFLNGTNRGEYDGLQLGSMQFSPDSNHVAFVATEGNQMRAIRDFSAGGKYDGIGELKFDPQGRKLAYVATNSGKFFVVVNEAEGKKYTELGKPSIVFSPNGMHMAYPAKLSGGQWIVVIDGKETLPYDGIFDGTIRFSPDSSKVAFITKSGGRFLLVIDGRERRLACDEVQSAPIFSADGQHVAVVIRRGSKSHLIVDGLEGRGYDALGDEDPVFGPESQIAYAAHRGAEWLVIQDDREVGTYELIGHVNFTPDSRLVIISSRSGYWSVSVGQTVGKPVRGVVQGSFVSAPKGGHSAYAAFVDGGAAVVADGHEGRHYDGIMDRTLRYSPSGEFVVYGAGVGSERFIVVNGVEGERYTGRMMTKPVFDNPKGFHYLVEDNGAIYLVHERIE